MIRTLWIAGVLAALSLPLNAQNSQPLADYGYRPPLNIPTLLSANYGELRLNHFHSGIDLKTQGVTGKPIYAVASGYVSRVAISPSGYGKALYIQHPNGTTSVYGHVEQFFDSLEHYVYRQQYARKRFALDLSFQPDQFPIRQGQLIALSGNRGSSGGPHLHFEIRDAAQRPYNLIAHHILPVRDTIPPRALTLYYVRIDTIQGIPQHRIVQRIPLRREASNRYVPTTGSTLSVCRQGYFAIEAKEYKNGTHNVMGLYRLQERLDGQPIFALEVDRVPFNVTRYANAVTLYSEQGKRNNIYRLFVLPNNPLDIYRNVRRQGLIALDDNQLHPIEIDLEDEAGNRSQISFSITLKHKLDTLPTPEGIPVLWWKDFQYDSDGLSVSIPARALYESVLFHAPARDIPLPSYAYSPLYNILSADEPLQKPITVSLAADGLPTRLRDKALLGVVSASGKRSAAGGRWINDGPGGRVEARVRNFGTYYIAVDTLPPRITPEFKSGADLSAQKSLSLKITDNFSGIASYSATIDGQWALLEYDPKNNRITHVFDDTRWPTGLNHKLSVVVSDAKGNSRTLHTQYRR